MARTHKTTAPCGPYSPEEYSRVLAAMLGEVARLRALGWDDDAIRASIKVDLGRCPTKAEWAVLAGCERLVRVTLAEAAALPGFLGRIVPAALRIRGHYTCTLTDAAGVTARTLYLFR